MITRYSLFIIFIVVISFFTGAFVKPVKGGDINIAEYKDPLIAARNLYAKFMWRGIKKEDSLAKKFGIISRVVDYNPDFKQAYSELCASSADYIKSDISLKDYLKLLRLGVERFSDNDITECYVRVLVGLERYTEIIDFLKKMQDDITDPVKREAFSLKLKALQNEKNVLDLTKAVEAYYNRTKTYPGDILVLVNEGLIDKIPDDPLGGQYFISRQGQVRTTSEGDIRNE